MYTPRQSWSAHFRQGDLIEVVVVVAPEIQVGVVDNVRDWMGAPSWGTTIDVVPVPKLRADRYLILSQCCDIGDPRILVAPLMPSRAIPWGSLTDEEAACVRANEVGVEVDTEDAVVTGPPMPGRPYSRLKLVLPGYFVLAAAESVLADEMVVNFAAARGMRSKDLANVTKLAELAAEDRNKLRNRLAVFFGRVPVEDEHALPTPTGAEAARPDLAGADVPATEVAAAASPSTRGASPPPAEPESRRLDDQAPAGQEQEITDGSTVAGPTNPEPSEAPGGVPGEE